MKQKLILFLSIILYIKGFAQCPVITVQPQPYSTICDNETFVVSIAAAGANLSYEWYRNGGLVPGQNSPVCSVLGVSEADAGAYRCLVIKNGCVSVWSYEATLSVTQVPHIIIQPQPTISAEVGQVITISLQATGRDLNYQWLHNGEDIPGANFSTLSISPATIDDAGTYRCIVSNESCPSAFSSVSNVEITNLDVESEVFKSLQMYPNPVSDNVYFQFGALADNYITVSLIDVQGKKIREVVFMGEEGVLDVSKVASGVYFVKVVSGDKTANRKLIVK